LAFWSLPKSRNFQLHHFARRRYTISAYVRKRSRYSNAVTVSYKLCSNVF